MRVLKLLMIVLSSMMLGFLLWNLTLSSDFEVTSSIDIQSGQHEVYPEIADLNNWQHWATYLHRENNMDITFSNPTTGKRAWVKWKMQDGPGGQLEIIDTSSTSIDLSIALLGLEASKSQIQIDGDSTSTQVNWTVNGNLPFFARFIKGRFEENVKADFKNSLTRLKEYVSQKNL